MLYNKKLLLTPGNWAKLFYKSELHVRIPYRTHVVPQLSSNVRTLDSRMLTLPKRHKAPQKMKNNFTENEFQTKTIGGIDILKTLVKIFSKS